MAARWAWIAGVGALLPALCCSADEPLVFDPGHRFVHTYVEDSQALGGIGIDLGWHADWNSDLAVLPSTGIRILQRHQTNRTVFGWTAQVRVAGRTPVAPFLEIGFDVGEVIGEMIIDQLRHDDEDRNWIDPDVFGSTGFSFNFSKQWSAAVYYKVHSIRGTDEARLEDAEVLGLSLTRHFGRRMLEWWQRPL